MAAPTAYCIYSDVESRLQRTYSTTSKPTQAQVTAFCVTVFNKINGILDARGYTQPVDTAATVASAILKEISTLGASAMAEEAKQSIGMAGSVSTLAVSLREQYEAEIRRLSKGELSLVDATEGTGTLAQADEQTPSGSFSLDDDGNERDPVFSRTMKF